MYFGQYEPGVAILEDWHFWKKQLILRNGLCYVQVTNAHQTTSHWGYSLRKTVLRPKVVGSSTCYFSFRSIQRNIITTSNFASTEFATTNGDRSTELTESFLLVNRYLDFDYDYCLQILTKELTFGITSSGEQEMEAGISCTECSQVTGLSIKLVCRSYLLHIVS